MMLGWVLGALAATPEAIDDRLRSIDTLEAVVDLARPVDRVIRMDRGGMEVTLTSGAMVPVFSGHFAGEWENDSERLLRRLRDREPGATLPSADQRGSRQLVGFVWVDGEGTVAVELPHEADALELANRQVLYAGADREAMRGVAHGSEPFVTEAHEGLFLSTSPTLAKLFLGPEATDPYEITVWAGSERLRRAVELLEQRVDTWDGVGVDLGVRVAEDRVAAEAGVADAASWVIDVHTADRYVRVSEQPTSEDRWLALIDGATLSRSWAEEVVTLGVTPQGYARYSHISGVPASPSDPSDPLSAPVSPHPLAIEHVEARVLVAHTANALTLPVELTNRVTLRATHDVAFVDLVVPRTEAEPASFTWVRAQLPDGTALARPEQVERKGSAVVTRAKPKPKPKPKPGDKPRVVDDRRDEDRITAHRVRLVFPEVVRAGDVVVVDLQWTDTWPLAHLREVDGVGMVSGGVTSGLQRFLASVEGASGDPYAYDVRVGLPEDSKLSAVVSGPDREETADGWRWTVVEGVTRARFPNVVVGRYRQRYDKASKGMPAVRVSLLGGDDKQLKGLAAQTRAVIAYYEGFLPPYGLDEYDVVEGPAALDHWVWVAPHAMQKMQQTQQTAGLRSLGRMDTTNDGNWSVFAHEIAHQWWGQQVQPAASDDRWMVESFAEMFACMATAKIHEDVDVCLDERTETRRLLEGQAQELADHRVSASLAEAYQGGPRGFVVYRYGPYVLQEMLRPRLGNDVFFLAIDQLLRDHGREPVTNERLQRAFERVSGRDLGDSLGAFCDDNKLHKGDH